MRRLGKAQNEEETDIDITPDVGRCFHHAYFLYCNGELCEGVSDSFE